MSRLRAWAGSWKLDAVLALALLATGVPAAVTSHLLTRQSVAAVTVCTVGICAALVLRRVQLVASAALVSAAMALSQLTHIAGRMNN